MPFIEPLPRAAIQDPELAELIEDAIRLGVPDEVFCGIVARVPHYAFSDAEKCALRYAERMYLAPQEVDAEFYAELKRHFSEAQIMELGAFIAFHYGMQCFMRTLDAA
jgi:alkylhydroperoxidase family enzyme